MNVHAQTQQLGQPPLTPAERIEAFMDAVTVYEVRHQEVVAQQEVLRLLGEDPKRVADVAALGELIMRRLGAIDAAMTMAKELMADGLLDRCVEILRIETAGRP